MKFLACILSGTFMAAMVGCTNVSDAESDGSTTTETEVLSVDTVGAEVNYDVRRRVTEEVDTVGATTEYQVEKRVVKKTVDIDTITQEVSRASRTDLEEGDYKTVDENVEQETVTEEVEVAPN